ncbi:MAG: immunoglobulin domain-containing protein [Holophaga sp.]|nr:immunoglobulin domain-containing protein [Holophaga sp.]
MQTRNLGARWAFCLLTAGLIALAPGCSTSGNDGNPIQIVAPSISLQPSSTQTVTAGTSVSFVVVATGTPAPTYQWKKDGVNIANATSATYTISAPVVGDSGTYTVTVTNSVSSVTSNGSVLTVNPAASAPIISTQPAATQTVTVGGSASFTVVANAPDGGALTYQWMKGASAIPGKTASTLTINPVALADAASYSVVVTNTLNGTTAATPSNAAVLTVNPAASAPIISTQPAATQTVTVGGSASFTVVANAPDGGALSYQWLKGGSTLAGKTASTLTISPVALADAASYSVVVTNTLNGTTATTPSNAAVLTVNPAATTPTISIQPLPVTVTEGDNASFSVTATGDGTLTYQWMKGGSAISGKTDATLNLTAVTTADAGNYSVEVTNTLNGTSASAISDVVALTVGTYASPTITTQPQSATVTAPDGKTFSVVATGTPLTYVWKKNGTAIPGQTGTSYTVAATDLHNVSDQYSVTVTLTGGGSIDSDAATLTVVAPKPVYAGDPTVTDVARPYSVVSSWYTTAPSDPTGSFRVGYDTALLNPVWSAACFFPSAPWAFVRPSTYPTDTRIPGSLAHADYTNTGYSRSHLTGFADLRDVYGADAGASTMYMSNMIPMTQTLNGGPWQSLETVTTQTLPATFGRVWTYSGPIFSTQLVAPMGAKAIPVPTAYYKVIVQEAVAGSPKVLALIVPHSTTVSSTSSPAVTMVNGDFWKFATTLDRVQTLTGLNFFPNPTSPLPAGFTSTVAVKDWGTNFQQGPNRPNVHMITPSWDSTFTHKHNSTNVITTIETTTAFTNVPVSFVAQAAADPDPIASTSWNFGDGSATDSNLSTTHSYTTAGTYWVTFTATDTAAHSSTITRVVTITGVSPNTPPTFTPATLADITATMGATIPNVTFTVADDTTAPGSILVSATSNNQTLLPDGSLLPVNTNGSVSMPLSPVTGQTGSALVTVTATDGDAAFTTKTFTLTVNANNPPTFTPDTLANVTTTVNTAKTATFTLSDDLTLPATLDIAVTSNNQTLLPDGTTNIDNVAGAITLTLNPAAGQVGTALVTVVATDGNAASTTRTFTLTVNSASAAPILIISQYYEGTSNNKWIEITNVGTAEWDATTTPMNLWNWANPYVATPTFQGTPLTGTLAVGASRIYKNSLSALPTSTNLTGTGITAYSCNFNGDDVVFLSPTVPSSLTANSTNGTEAYAARIDVIGVNDSALWMGNTGTTAGGTYAKALGMNRSYVRKSTINLANITYTPGEWTQVDAAEITTTAPSSVDTAAADSTNRLGVHVYIP